MDNILQMQGIQPELRRALGKLGSLAIPFGTPVNAVASQVVLADADLDLLANGDMVNFAGLTLTKAAAPGDNEWVNAAGLAALINTLTDWNAAENAGAVTITAAARGAAWNGNIAVINILEDTTAGGGAAAKATATIAAATIARLAIGDTVGFADSVFTMAAATSVQDNEFKDQAGLIACLNGLIDWTAEDSSGAVAIEAADDSSELNGVKVIVTLKRVTAGGVDGTPGFQGAVCCDATYIYVCTATDTTIQNNNWERLANALQSF